MKIKLVALIDCSSFYCSCERAFRADLKDVPIVVLSNNDGCIISLTQDAKAQGFTMGEPYHKCRAELEKKGVAVFSSNYTLYSDMSRRVVNTIKQFSEYVEQYSIDEAFIMVDADTENLERERERIQKLAQDMYVTILRNTGIYVRISFAETKTLAKIGSVYTKELIKQGQFPAVCFWEHPEKSAYMKKLSVHDVWGVGWKWAKKLQEIGIKTAEDLSKADPRIIKKKFSIVMERTVHELAGLSCIDFDVEAEARKSIIRSRMFAHKLNNPTFIKQAVIAHVSRGAEKLRKEGLVANSMSVFISTGKHGKFKRYGYASSELNTSTNDTFVLTKFALDLFDQCYSAEDIQGNKYMYSKTGISLGYLQDVNSKTGTLFDFNFVEQPEVMKSLDEINRKFGKYTIALAGVGILDKIKMIEEGKKGAIEWGMRREKLSPRYTTKLKDIMKVKI